ncbi:Ku protein [Peterkaempfera sp. SMS 1(5)a]|uniref:Ku protein n=1 Tax=Peterkaempfera podocarpi TaxID=3232308 RepID=UPI0036721524
MGGDPVPQTMAKVHISFGLVSIPVAVYSATEQHTVPLHQVHAKDGGRRIRQKRYCEIENIEVPYAEVVRGYEAPDARTVVLAKDDLADLPLPTVKSIEVLAFVAGADIDREVGESTSSFSAPVRRA